MISAFVYFTGGTVVHNQSIETSFNIDILDSTNNGDPINQDSFVITISQGDTDSDVNKKVSDAAILKASSLWYTLNKKDILTVRFNGSI